jgi:tetratricopeptide (TPR) repeat protein
MKAGCLLAKKLWGPALLAYEQFLTLVRTDSEFAADAYAVSRIPYALVNKGMALKGLNRKDEALQAFGEAIMVRFRFFSDFFRFFSCPRRTVFLIFENWKQKMKDTDPVYAEALINKGLISYELRRFPDALQALERASTLVPGNNRLLPILIQLYAMAQKYPEALAVCEKACIVSPNDPFPVAQKATVLLSLRRLPEVRLH